MSLNEVIFIDNLPSLDLHGIDSQTAIVMINDFIRDNKIMKNKIIVIIHGIGSGVIMKTTKQTLIKNKNVLNFKSCSFNRGCTLVELNLTK